MNIRFGTSLHTDMDDRYMVDWSIVTHLSSPGAVGLYPAHAVHVAEGLVVLQQVGEVPRDVATAGAV